MISKKNYTKIMGSTYDYKTVSVNLDHPVDFEWLRDFSTLLLLRKWAFYFKVS